jgi:subtilisin family serine protease
MFTQRILPCPLLLGLLVILAGTFWPWVTAAQTTDYSYPDKMFGGQYTFTLKADEIMVRLGDQASGKATRMDAEKIATAVDLEIFHDEGIDTHRFVVFRTRPGKSATAALGALKGRADVSRAYPALQNADGTTRYFLPDQVVVQFDPGLSEAAMLDRIARLGCEIAIDHWTPGFYTLTVPADRDVFDQIRAFNDLDEIQFAELSTISFNDESFVPNDPLYSNQWAMKNTGAVPFTNDADGDVQEAWDIERGNANVIVAVIDTGVDWDHPDLQPNILQNLGEDFDGDGQTMVWDGTNWVQDPGDLNGVDNDGNGQIDDLFGWDFSNNDNNPDPGSFGNGHGTSCSGLVAAVGNNSLGVAGVAHNCRIMPVMVDLTSGVNQNRADAINYVVGEAGNYDAMVISCSWICSSGSTISVQNAVVNARAADILPVFAAGNANGTVNFPANLNEAMAIAATSPCDERKNPSSCDGESWGSNFGTPLSIGSPGVLMQTTDIGGSGGYASGDYTSTFNGTSAATPFTAGAVALLHSEAIELTGSALTADDAERLLEDSAEQVGGYTYTGGVSLELGNGRINVNEALQLLVAENLVALLPPPVDVALSIDRSYSMVGDNILAAENAAAQVVRLMDVGDRIAVTSYSGGTDPGTTPDWPAWTDFPTTEIVGDATKNAAIATIETGGDVYNLTAIGAGMQTARDELFDALPPQYPQSIILMSDGNNTDGPDPLTILPLLSPEPKVYTIGFGSYADEVTLQGIATATGGEYFFAGTSGTKTTGGVLPLIQTYQMSLMEATERQSLDWLNGQLPNQGSNSYEFLVDPSVDQILISLLWGYLDPNAFDLYLIDPEGKTYDPSSPEWLGDETVSAYRITLPKAGYWVARVVRQGQGEGRGNYHLNLACSSRVQSTLNLIPRGFGVPMLAKLRLVQLIGDVGVKPLTGAQVPALLTYPNGETTQLVLNDQGFDGDQVADDGIYCATIPDTYQHGSYLLESTAFGLTLEGYPFTRYDVDTAVLNREQEEEPVPVILPHATGMPGTLLTMPILVPQWVNPLQITQMELGFAFNPDVIRFVELVEPNGTMLENWNLGVDNHGDAVVLYGEGEPLQGQGLLVQLQFEIVGQLGAFTPTPFVALTLKDANGNNVPAEGSDGSVTVGSPMPDQTPVLYPVFPGWSMRSLPVVLGADQLLQEQLPAVQEVLRWGNGQYIPTNNPPAGGGTWMNYGGPLGEKILVGDPLGRYRRVLPAGWSLIGGLFEESAVPVGEPQSAMVAMFRHIPGRGYLPAVQIDPGLAYWFYAAAPFTLTVDPNLGKPDTQFSTSPKVASEAELMARGQEMAGIPSVSSVMIGAGANEATKLPYPPSPPEFTTQIRLLDTEDPALALFSDIRLADIGEFWFLEVHPGGNVNGSGTTLIWDPDALRIISDVAWALCEGLNPGGHVLVDDMRNVGAFSLNGVGPQYFTIRSGVVSAVENDVLPETYALTGNHPNPFNPITNIRYEVPSSGRVRVDIFDVSGRRVTTLVDQVVEAGRHSVVWNGRDHRGAMVPSGVYFSRLSAENVRLTDRMTLLK